MLQSFPATLRAGDPAKTEKLLIEDNREKRGRCVVQEKAIKGDRHVPL